MHVHSLQIGAGGQGGEGARNEAAIAREGKQLISDRFAEFRARANSLNASLRYVPGIYSSAFARSCCGDMNTVKCRFRETCGVVHTDAYLPARHACAYCACALHARAIISRGISTRAIISALSSKY